MQSVLSECFTQGCSGKLFRQGSARRRTITMSGTPPLPSIYVVSAIPLFWIAVGLAGLVHKTQRDAHARLYFLLGAAGGLVLAIAAYPALAGDAHGLVLPLGLPDLP